MKWLLYIIFIFFTLNSIGQGQVSEEEKELLNEVSRAKSDTAKIRIYNKLGSILRRKEQAKAKYYWTKCLELINKEKDPTDVHDEYMASSYNGLGVIEKRLGNYPAALDYYFKSLGIAQALNDSVRMGTAFFNIGAINRTIKEYDEALIYYKKSLHIRKKMKKHAGVQNCYNGLGVTHRRLNHLDSAQMYYLMALDLAKEQLLLGQNMELNSITRSNALAGLAVVMEINGEVNLAIDYFKRALNLQISIENKHGIITSMQSLGTIYSRNGNRYLAEKILLEALELAHDGKYLKSEANLSLRLSIHYSSIGNYKLAYEYVKDYQGYQEDLINKEQTKEMAQREMTFLYDKKSAADSIKNADKQKILSAQVNARNESIKRKDLELRQDRIVKYGLIIGLILAFTAMFFIYRQNKMIGKEKKRSEELLHNILPIEIAKELKLNGVPEPKLYENVTVLFTDFKGFTQLSEKLTPKELVEELDYCFKNFDKIIGKYRIEKIKTIGDAYMAVAGLPEKYENNADHAVGAAIELRDFMSKYRKQRLSEGRIAFEMRIGLHSGAVVAGIVGTKKFAYDIWGDTVNTAARMESSGEPGKVNVSGITMNQLGPDFLSEFRGKIEAKNKGKIDMYFIETA